jgi:hypothetical protein
MISRSPIPFRHFIADSLWPQAAPWVGAARLGFANFYNVLAGIVQSRTVLPDSFAPASVICVGNDAALVDFPFLSRSKAIESKARKIQKRGFAVCVNLSLFSRLLPRSVWLAVSKTPLRRLIMLPCAQSVVLQQARLLPMQPAAAKPKARLLARWLVAFRAAYLACRPATDFGLTTPLYGGIITSAGPFGGNPRMAFLHFRASRALSRKGCYV